MKKPVMLVVLDGWGFRAAHSYNAIQLARKPTFDYLWEHYPHALLKASGIAVGLPENIPGNSEVGHIILGAGRIIEQPLTIVNKAIADGSFYTNPLLVTPLQQAAHAKKTVHIIGLFSNGNVHSAESHIYAYITAALQAKVPRIIMHAILDGRDVPPRSAEEYLERFDQYARQHPSVTLGTIMGRFYGMDRDDNWDRTADAYECLTDQQPIRFKSWRQAIDYFYAQDISDEFIPPTPLLSNSVVQKGDGIIFFNVRPDRARQLIEAFVRPTFEYFAVKKLDLSFFITPVPLNHTKGISSLFPFPPIKHTLKQVLAEHHKTMLCVAETEKYAHVTYFFSGGSHVLFKGEKQLLIPSLKLKNYIEHPCMSAVGITHAVLESLSKDPVDFYLINYANADMVGHSGDLNATVKAIECLDEQLKQLYDQVVKQMHGTLLITADHGNAELKFDEKHNQPSTAHTTNPVPFIAVSDAKENTQKLSLTELADVAPYILKIMHVPVPKEMG